MDVVVQNRIHMAAAAKVEHTAIQNAVLKISIITMHVVDTAPNSPAKQAKVAIATLAAAKASTKNAVSLNSYLK